MAHGYELRVSKLYEKQPIAYEVIGYLNDFGFDVYDITMHYWNRNNVADYGYYNKGKLVFGDVLFFKSPEAIISDENISEDKIIRAMIVYLAYGYFDLIETLLSIAVEKKLILNELSNSVRFLLKKYSRFTSLIPNRNRKVYIYINLLLNRLFRLFGVYEDTGIGSRVPQIDV